MKATIEPTCGRAVRNSFLDCDQGAAITWIAERNVSWIVIVARTEIPYFFRGTLAAEIADHMVFGPTNEIEYSYVHWTHGVTAIELMTRARFGIIDDANLPIFIGFACIRADPTNLQNSLAS